MERDNKLCVTVIVAILFFSITAQAADRYVAVSGSDTSNDCTNSVSPCATIDHAVDGASSGDTIKIARGTYHESVTLDTPINPLTIQGGWSTDFSQRDEDPAATVIDADDASRVFYIHLISADVTLEGLTLTGGYNASSGGGVYAGAQAQTISLTLNNLILDSNSGGNDGGAVLASASQSGNMTLTIADSIIRNNDATHGAGVAVIATSDGALTATLTNSIIADNSSVYNGGGLYVSASGGDAEVDLMCNTITNNTGPTGQEFGGAVWLSSGYGNSAVVNSTNNIIWGNSANDIFIQPDDAVSSAQVNAAYCDIGHVTEIGTGVYADNGNNDNFDPLFMNASAGNYHLKNGSPCIGAGIYAKRVWLTAGSIWVLTNYGVPTEDLDGDSRNTDWVQVSTNTQYKYCDIGADEYTPGSNPGIFILLLANNTEP
jgi:hypothetical protein